MREIYLELTKSGNVVSDSEAIRLATTEELIALRNKLWGHIRRAEDILGGRVGVTEERRQAAQRTLNTSRAILEQTDKYYKPFRRI